jgi:hypothetical protein
MSEDAVDLSDSLANRARVTAGYDFQDRLTQKIIERFSGYRSVTIEDAHGNVIDQSTRRRGADGGTDLIIRIDAKTPAAAKRIANQVEAALRAIT